MARNNEPLLLLNTQDEKFASESFIKFVKGEFGDDVAINNVQGVFNVWQKAKAA